MSADDRKQNPEPGLLTPEEIAMFGDGRKLRERSDDIVRRSQAAARPFSARQAAPRPDPHGRPNQNTNNEGGGLTAVQRTAQLSSRSKSRRTMS